MNFRGAFERRGGGFGESEVANLTSAHELRHRADGLFDGRVRVNAVQIVKIDPVDSEALQARVAGRANVVGASVDSGDRTAMAHKAELGGEEDLVALLFAETVEPAADQLFVGVRA